MKLSSSLQLFSYPVLALLITACSGGPMAQVCNSWEAGPYVKKLNEYMPITEGATMP